MVYFLDKTLRSSVRLRCMTYLAFRCSLYVLWTLLLTSCAQLRQATKLMHRRLSVIFFRLEFLNIYIPWNFFRKNMFPKSIYMELKNWTHLTLKQRQAINSSKLLCFSRKLCTFNKNTMMNGDSVFFFSMAICRNKKVNLTKYLGGINWYAHRIQHNRLA